MVIDIGCMILNLIVISIVSRYYLHMLQLNGYKTNEYSSWLMKNKGKQGILLLCIIPFLLVRSWTVSLASLVILLQYVKYIKGSTKKKFVCTQRVTRLVMTLIVMHLVVLLVAYFTPVNMVLVSVALVFFAPVTILLGTLINKPIEKQIQNGFIKDAKRILKEAGDGLTVIGITGSYGKTSVKYYLETLLKEKFRVLVTPLSYNTPMGVVKTIRESLNPMHEIFVCEMGARYVGDIQELCDIVHPTMGIITSVGEQHLETFESVPNIVNTKFELARCIGNSDSLFINAESPLAFEKYAEFSQSVWYSSEEKDGCVFGAKNIVLSDKGTEFTVVYGEKEQVYRTQLIGMHNIVNIIGAISIACKLGMELEELILPIRRIKSVEHRMELRTYSNDMTIIDDAYNSNPVGSKAALETLSLFDGTKILVTPGMVELGAKEEELNFAFGTYAAICDYVFLVGINRTKPIRDGLASTGFDMTKCASVDALEEAMGQVRAVKSNQHKYVLLENDLPDNY